MNSRFLLDTNVLSEPLRPVPSRRTEEHLKRHARELATASVVWHELKFGCARLAESARKRALERYLSHVVGPSIPILGYDTEAGEWYAKERARLEAQGMRPPFADGQIAAIAAVNELVLVTRNTADYRHFAGLRVVDWS